MRERGYVEGRSLVVESYYAHGNVDRIVAQLPAIAATSPDAVVVLGGQLVRALKEAGFTLPVVFIYSGDPVEAKFAASFARPGGNFTGVSLFMAELVTKRIEILREMLPRARRIAFIGWSRHAGVGVEVRVSLDAAKRAGMEANYLPADNGADIAAAYDEAARTGAQAVFPFPDAVSLAAASAMSEYSRRHRMPTIAGWAEFTLQGNLMSYGPNREAVYAHLASFVDRIAKGAKAADIPIERPTVHEFVVNLKAARDLGITIPPSILARASQAID
jgi:putative ABC transport system substrate-binding protein